MEEHLALFCLSFCSQALLEESISSRWQHTLPEAKPLMTCHQGGICLLGLFPVHNMHKLQLHCLNSCLSAQTFMLFYKPFIGFGLPSVGCAHNRSLKQGLDSLPAVVDGDSTQHIHSPVISTLLVLKLKLKQSQFTYPSVPHSVQIGCCQHIREWVVVGSHHKWCVCEIFLEMLHHTPFQGEEL